MTDNIVIPLFAARGRKIFPALFILLLAFSVGCTKKDPIVINCQITNISTTSNGDITGLEINYDSSDRVYFINQTVSNLPYLTWVYAYDQNNKVLSGLDGSNSFTWYYSGEMTDSITYDAVFADGDGELNHSSVAFTYAQGRVISYYYWYSVAPYSTPAAYQRIDLTYNGDNVSTAISTTGNFSSSATTVTTVTYPSYDSKNNPSFLISKAMGNSFLLAPYTPDPTAFSKNNVLKKLVGNMTDIITYDYTADGYPTKSVDTQTGGTSQSVSTTTYTYSLCK